jgi:hypothetical protein
MIYTREEAIQLFNNCSMFINLDDVVCKEVVIRLLGEDAYNYAIEKNEYGCIETKNGEVEYLYLESFMYAVSYHNAEQFLLKNL